MELLLSAAVFVIQAQERRAETEQEREGENLCGTGRHSPPFPTGGRGWGHESQMATGPLSLSGKSLSPRSEIRGLKHAPLNTSP